MGPLVLVDVVFLYFNKASWLLLVFFNFNFKFIHLPSNSINKKSLKVLMKTKCKIRVRSKSNKIYWKKWFSKLFYLLFFLFVYQSVWVNYHHSSSSNKSDHKTHWLGWGGWPGPARIYPFSIVHFICSHSQLAVLSVWIIDHWRGTKYLSVNDICVLFAHVYFE